MQIDLSDEQPEKAWDSIRSTLEFDSNVKVESERQSQKHDVQRVEICDQILTSEDRPKYRITETPSKSRRKYSRTEKWRFPSAIVILEMPLPANAEPSIN
jgi:hypothetical protein